MGSLPLRVRPRTGESASSILCRLADRHGQWNVPAFARWVGLDFAQTASGRSNELLGELIGFTPNDVDALQGASSQDQTISFRGRELVLQHDWFPPHSRHSGGTYCPLCLSDDLAESAGDPRPPAQRTYWRAHWDVSAVRSCNRHRVLLVQGCPNATCGAPVTLTGSSLYLCFECHADLRKAPVRPLADGSGRFQAYALGRIGEGEPRSVRWLDDLRLHQAEELCWRLGSAVKRFSRSLLDQAKGDPIEFQVECDEGLSICEGGPDAVEALLDRVCDHVDNKAAGPNSAYGPFYRWLVNKRRTHPPHVMLLRDLVRTHAVREIPFMQDDTMFGEDVRDNVHISVRSAALQIPLQYRSFVRTALELELMDEKDVRLRRFRRDRLEALEEGRRLRPVARTEFINAFGVGSEGLNWLFRTGRLTEVVGRWPGIPGDEYQAVLKRIGVHRRVSDVDFEFLTLGDERLRRMQAVTALIDGTIVSPGAISPDDPLTLILAVEDVERLGLGKRRVPVMSEAESLEPELDVAPEEKEDLSFPELRQRMSWRAPLARDLLATGLFDVTTVRRTGQMRISVSSIREFERRYVLSTDLHKRYSLPWGDRLRETMVLEGMSVVRLPRHPRIDLLVVDEVEARMAAMRRHRHGWFCDYHRDRDRGDRIRPGRKPDHRGRPDETEERGDHSTQPEGLSAKLGTTSP